LIVKCVSIKLAGKRLFEFVFMSRNFDSVTSTLPDDERIKLQGKTYISNGICFIYVLVKHDVFHSCGSDEYYRIRKAVFSAFFYVSYFGFFVSENLKIKM